MMRTTLISITLALLLVGPVAWAQNDEPDDEGETVAEVEDTAEGEIDDSDLDEQTYEGDDDVFVPSEEIPADEPIPFPSNI